MWCPVAASLGQKVVMNMPSPALRAELFPLRAAGGASFGCNPLSKSGGHSSDDSKTKPFGDSTFLSPRLLQRAETSQIPDEGLCLWEVTFLGITVEFIIS